MTTKKKPEAVEPLADPVRRKTWDQNTRRDDNDATIGHGCDVVSGPYQGRHGVYMSDVTFDKDGLPSEVTVRTRDDNDENIVVAHKDLRPSTTGAQRH